MSLSFPSRRHKEKKNKNEDLVLFEKEHAAKLLGNARSWRPVTVEMPRQAQPPQSVSTAAGTGSGGHRSEATGAAAGPSTGAGNGGHRSEATGTAAGEVQQTTSSSEESMELEVANQVAIPPPVEWGGPRTFDIRTSEITDIVPRWSPLSK